MPYKIDAKQHRSRLGRYRTYQPFGVGIFLRAGLGSCGSVGSVADCGDGGSER